MAINKKGRQEFLNDMIKEVRDLPIEKVVGNYVELERKGAHYQGLCPFHLDHEMGSFIVTPGKNIWHCFTDGIGGNPITFEMMYQEKVLGKKDVRFLDTCFRMAKEYGIISQEEYETFSRKKWDENLVLSIRRSIEEKEKQAEITLPTTSMALVYNAMAKVCGLSEKHRRHLLEVRGVPESSLGDFFTFPTRKMYLHDRIMEYLEKRLTESVGEQKAQKILKRVERDFPNIPGFYRVKKTGKIDFAPNNGIGILVRDNKGRAVGIQVRHDKGETRYVWFSSSFAQSNSAYEGGASPGAPGGILYPENPKKDPDICITEGRFKAVKIAEQGNIAIYVSGVSSWKRILPLLDAEIGEREKIFLMFDADMMGNTSVHKQLESLAMEVMAKQIEPVLILWSKELGKGFDDLVLANPDFKKLLKAVKYGKFAKSYEQALHQILKQYGVSKLLDVPKDKAKQFTEDLQAAVEWSLKLP